MALLPSSFLNNLSAGTLVAIRNDLVECLDTNWIYPNHKKDAENNRPVLEQINSFLERNHGNYLKNLLKGKED